MSDEQLIELVKQYSAIYDKSSNQYRDNRNRNIAWEEIAEHLYTTVENCKERWGKLRNCYTNALKRRYKKSGQAATNYMPWKFEEQMDFLLPHVKGRRTSTNLSTDIKYYSTEDSRFSEEPVSPGADPISPAGSSPVRSFLSVRVPTPISAFHRTNHRKENDHNYVKEMVDAMKSPQESSQNRTIEMMDETDQFFLSMSKQLKKLPRLDQSNIKFQMHKLIHDAEIIMIKKSENSKNKISKCEEE